MKLSQINMNNKKSFCKANPSKDKKKKLFRNLKKTKKEVNVMSSIAFNKAFLNKILLVK